mgnify:CR=1 FL=1
MTARASLEDTRELFRALELAHYAERFRYSTFVIALPAAAPFGKVEVNV